MQRNRMTWMAAMLGMAAVTSLVGCGKGMNATNGSGAAVLNAKINLSNADIAGVTVHVQGAVENVDLTVPMAAQGTQYSAVVSSLPIGTDYVFTASAKNASNTEIFHGAVSGQTILKNQTANIVIDMNQNADPQLNSQYNEAPVVAGLTATATCVSKDDTVTIKATAFDPDAGDTAGMGWSWTVDSTCGTLSAPVNVAGTDQAHPGTSTVIFTATSSSANCQVNVSIADARMPAVLMTTGSLTVSIGDSCAHGNAKITAIPNTCPVVASVGAAVTPPSFVPMVVGQSTLLSVSATDVDGDTLGYTWTSPDCAGGTPTTTFGNFNSAPGLATMWFLLTSAPPSGTCTFLVHVSDGTFADGKPKCDIVNHLSLPVKGAGDVVKANPVFGYDYQTADTVSDGDTVKLEIVAPNTGCDTAYALAWSAGAALTTLDPPFTTGVTFTAPAGASDAGASVTVTATCPSSGLSTVHSFIMVGATAFCNGKANGLDCTSNAQLKDKCVTAASCQNNLCVATTSVVCSPSTTLCMDNACVPTTGVCALKPTSDGTSCNDSKACTTADKCSAGTCGGTAVTCTATGNPCMVNACAEPSGTCVAAAAPNGTVCSDGNGCSGISTAATGSDPGISSTVSDACAAGVCVAGPAVTCSTSGDVCTSMSAATFSCGVAQCLVSNYAVAEVPPMAGLSSDPSTGTPWITGTIYTPFDFGTGTVLSTGSADMYLAKLNPTTGSATNVFLFGDGSSKDQVATGVAVASSGNVGVVGTTNGEIDFTADALAGNGTPGVDTLTATVSTPFYAVLSGASTGSSATAIQAHMVDLGTGSIMAIASNPTVNAFAICGKTSKIIAAYSSTNAGNKGVRVGGQGNTVFGGGNTDLFVAKIDGTTGLVLWGAQYGAAGDQTCESLSIDSSGNVLIAGNYSGDLFGLANVADVSGTTAVLFAAKLASSNGALMSAKAWVGTGRSDANGLAIDKDGNVIIAGAIGSAVNFGTGAVAFTGLTDLFVAKFDSSFTGTWAISDGDAGYDQSVKAVATDSNGNIFISGSFKGNMPYLGLGDSTHNGALDGFVATLLPTGGVKDCAKAYGDATGAQAVTMLSVPRTATANKDAIYEGGAFTSTIKFGGTTLTQSGTATNSFFSRATK